MADINESLSGALENLKTEARKENAEKIRGEVKIINKQQIRAMVEQFVKEFGTDREMAAKIEELENRLQQLNAEKENLSSNAQTEKDELLKKISAIETERDELKKSLEEADLDNLNTLKLEAEKAKGELETANEKLSKLEAIVQGDDLKEKLKNLEYELIELKKAYHEALLGLEFVDYVEEADFNALLAKAAELKDSTPPAAAARIGKIERQLKISAEKYDNFVKKMLEGKGTIMVAAGIIRHSLKAEGFKNELEMAEKFTG